MKKYQYQINDRVLAFDNEDWIILGTITAKDGLVDACYYEFEIKPAPKPSFLTRLLAHFNKR